MPGCTEAGDKPDIPPPYLSSTYLEISLLINHEYKVQVAEQEVRNNSVRLGTEFCAHIKEWLWVKPLNREKKKKKLKRFWSTPSILFPVLSMSYADNTQSCVETAQNSNDMRNSRNYGVYLDTHFSVMTSSIQYYVTVLQITKTGIYIAG